VTEPTPPRTAAARAASRGAGIGRSIALFWRVLRSNPLSLVGFVLVFLIVVATGLVYFAPAAIGVHYPLNQPNSSALGQPPSWAHPFGTDPIGIDIYSNVMAALPVDLAIAFAIAFFSLVAGGFLGLVAGFWDRPGTVSGAASVVILRVTDVFLAFPSLILALAIAVSLGRGVPQVIIAIMVTWWPYYTRLVRGEVLAIKHRQYVTAARVAGVRESRILFRHVVRNVIEPVVVYFTMDIGTVIVTFSTVVFVIPNVISFPSTNLSEWGVMIQVYQDSFSTLPWTVLAPGLAIFLTVLSFSLLGDGLRDVLDPRTRRAMLEAQRQEPAAPIESAEEAEGGELGSGAPAPAGVVPEVAKAS
jgi:peptide/nickel transport system permease protein